MDDTLKVLVVEDSDDDAVLLIRMLRKGGYNVEYARVDTLDDMHAALTQEDWDVIISDYVLPNFNGIAALKLIHEMDADLPFIIVSGTIGEDLAVEAMRAGAHDYLMKDNLTRLIPAIQREMQEARMRHDRRQRERELSAIATIATSLREATTHDDIITILHDQLIDIVVADGLAVAIHDQQAELMKTEFASGQWQETQGLRLQSGQGITGKVVKSRQPYVTDNIFDDPHLMNRDFVGDLRSVICVPLIAEELVVGVIWLGRRSPFSDEDLRLLTAINDIAASALHRASILETLEHRVRERTAELESMNERSARPGSPEVQVRLGCLARITHTRHQSGHVSRFAGTRQPG